MAIAVTATAQMPFHDPHKPTRGTHSPYQAVTIDDEGHSAMREGGPLYAVVVQRRTEYELDADSRSRLEDTLNQVATRAPNTYAVAHKKAKGMTPFGSKPCLFWCPKCTWVVGLYTCTIALELTAVIFGILHGARLIREKRRPTGEVVIMQILLCLSFAIKIPYLKDKVLALVTLSVLIVGYAAIAVVLLIAANEKGAT